MLIALGVTGGIGAYKAVEVARGLQNNGHDVVAVMTEHATQFVGPVTFEAITRRPVITGQYEPGANADVEHVALATAIDLLLVAPATANIIGKFANGIADDFLSTLYLATRAPVVLAPAMNTNMWEHEAVQRNLQVLAARGVGMVEPGEGFLACGCTGKGRLAEPGDIVAAAGRGLKPAQTTKHERHAFVSGVWRGHQRARRPLEDDLAAYLEVREVLELKALDLSRPRIRKADLLPMLAGNPAAENGRPARLDNRLHDYLVEKSGNRYLRIFFSQPIAAYFTAAFEHAAPEAHVVADMAAQHRAILEALIARRWGRAYEALGRHIRAQKPILMRILRAGWLRGGRRESAHVCPRFQQAEGRADDHGGGFADGASGTSRPGQRRGDRGGEESPAASYQRLDP